ncbi:uncharacterized protein LOC121876461 isoform X2 [Homarus americanus]|uniref:uncharacterized protein LOC121876461 isoform X2 n=1 Tax=Homarus americanus TaxID=6706 RepID=UPI001C48C842|nr:uncharacterized protein LOC121876461 isoform X2 [Homarus americanus]
MGGGSGRAGATLLLLLVVAAHVCPAPVPEATHHAHARHGNLTLLTAAPARLRHTQDASTRPYYLQDALTSSHHPHVAGTASTPAHETAHGALHGRAGGRRGRGHSVQYTLDLLPSPASGEVEEDARLASQVTVEVQLLPWLEEATLGGRAGCVHVDVVSKAAHLALQHQPPPAGVSVVVLPPPSDFTCTERHGVEYLLMQMTSPTTQVLIGGVEPGLCRVASHLARKYHKLFLPWSCLEIPALEHNGSPPIHAHTQEEEEEEEERESAMTVGVRDEGSHVAMVTPTALKVAWAARAALTHLGWRHVCIITLDSRYWRGLAHTVDVELRSLHHQVPTLAVLPTAPSLHNITKLFNIRATKLIKAYLLVLPSSSPVLGRVLQEAEVEGVTRHSTFFILDPLYAPVPAFTPTHAHDHKTPRAHQAAQQPLHAHDGQDKKRFKGLKQLSDLSTEAARAVMVLAAATRGPPNMAAKGGVETNTDKNTPTDTHTNASPGHKTGGGGGGGEHKNKRRDREREGQRTEAEGRRRVVLPPAITALPLNQSVASESEAVLTRLVYDSVSLLSHLLRANVGTFRLRRKSNGAKNYTSEDLKPTGGQNGSVRAQRWKRMDGVRMVDRNHHRPAAVYDWLPSTRLARSDAISSLLIRDLKGDLYLAEDEAERERLYFEMKKLDTERQGRDFEKKLESIIGSRRIKENGFNRHKKTEGGLNKSQIIEMKLKKPTFFPALWGDGFVSTSGERRFDFLVLDWHPRTQELVTVLELKDNTVGYSEVSEWSVVRVREIDWSHDTPIPRDQDCGNSAICGYVVAGVRLAPGYVVMIVLCLLFVLAACCGFAAVMRKHLRQKEMSRGPYKILLTSSDLTLSSRPDTAARKPGSGGTGERPDLLRGSFSSTHRPIPHDSLLSTASHAANKDGEEAKAKYNGDFVHLRYFYVPTGNFEVKNRTMTLLKQMRDQRHENINGFQGMLCDPIRPGLVFDYCSRRSLEDIIRQEDIKLDWSFRLSLLTDLVRGMRYLHGSLFRHHGRLTSRNCVIDARWVLKVTDYGLPGIYEYQNLTYPNKPIRDLLWKAPELLRDEALMIKGTQPGDVFSFAIIMQEVVVRGAPYCMVQLTPQEILARLKKPPPMIRPSVSKGAAPPDAINIMKQCWAELPDMRPDFNQINDLFKKLNQGRRLNIVDTMFQMLEKYSSNLEELIRDRTEQLDLEKKKTEQLLNRMLPSSVADQLKLGMPVAPEEFDEVTIYFSDIVGFTSISAYSTPFEVVDLLNDLYTAFDSTINHYNVYKVETIGDAYMVVGGVPTKIDDHASQIATMALDLLHLSGKFRIRHLHNIPLMLRIGIHTGPCCAGVVGMTMPRYCLFGDTVNTASRMESTGSAWRIHVSEKTWTVLRDVGGYHLEFRGLTKLKGKGEMNTYWLLGKEGFLKDLPVPPEIGYTHRLDEELVRLGRQHYMARRDSTVDSLASIKGFSSIHAAKMQNEALEASVCEEEVAGGSGDARMMLSVLQQLSSESEGVPTQDAEGEGSSSPRVVVPNGRTHLEASCIIVKEANKSCKDDSSSTKQVSKSNCVKSKSQSSVPKNICDSVVVVPKTYSRERRESHHRSRHSHARSRSPQPSAPLLQANHVDHTSEIELQMGSVIANTPVENSGNIGTHAFHGGDHRVFCKSNSGGKRCTAEEDTDDPSGRASNFPPGPRRESCRGSNTPRTASPPMLCHNKVFPQHDMSSPVRDRTTTWGHGPLPGAQQEMGGMRPTALQGVTAECQVHPHTQDPPSPTESTML